MPLIDRITLLVLITICYLLYLFDAVLFMSSVAQTSAILQMGSRQSHRQVPFNPQLSTLNLRSGLKIINNDPTKLVAVCDENSDCDDLAFEWPSQPKKAIVITSSISGKRFSVSNLDIDSSNEILIAEEASKSVKINVDIYKKHQTIMGWGGAFTDATCYNIAKVNSRLGDKLIASYYGPKGLRYNFGRVPLAGSDFSMRPYTYDDSENNQPDLGLENWSLAKEDFEYKIPVIQRALQLSGNSSVKLFASPWSAPSWMKTTKSVVRGHLLNNDTIYDAYSKYLVKFFDAYRQEGLEFWGATVQNEPGSSYFPFYFFNSLQFSSSEMARFVGKYYGPALRASGRTKENFKLMIGDDSLGFVNFQVPSVMKDNDAAQYISGLAFHWYTSGKVVSYNMLNRLYDQIGKQIEFVMMSEACTGSMPTIRGPSLGDWSRAEAYASDIIEDLKRHTSSWIDWNMVLDHEGGPNWSKNFVDSPIIVDASKQLFYKQPMYYGLAHFTTLFPAGCHVLLPVASGSPRKLSYIGCYIEESNHVVINVLNESNQHRVLEISINYNSTTPPVEIEPRSLSSFLIKM